MGSAHSQCSRQVHRPANEPPIPSYCQGTPLSGQDWTLVGGEPQYKLPFVRPVGGPASRTQDALSCWPPSARQTLAWGRLDPQVCKNSFVLPREKGGGAPGQNPSFSPAQPQRQQCAHTSLPSRGLRRGCGERTGPQDDARPLLSTGRRSRKVVTVQSCLSPPGTSHTYPPCWRRVAASAHRDTQPNSRSGKTPRSATPAQVGAESIPTARPCPPRPFMGRHQSLGLGRTRPFTKTTKQNSLPGLWK